MPSFVYFATFEESVRMLKDLCSAGFRIVPEPGPFDVPEAQVHATVTDALEAVLQDAPNHYLTGSFARFPVQFSRLASGAAAGRYAINLLAQGPLMQSLVGRVRTVEGRPTLLPGDVSFETSYRNPETNGWEKASPELKAAYRKAVSIVKNRCVRPPPGAAIFIGPDALALLESGEVRIHDPRVHEAAVRLRRTSKGPTADSSKATSRRH